MTDKPAIPSDSANSDRGSTRISFTVPSWLVAGGAMTPEAFSRWVRIAAAQYRYARSEISFEAAAALAGVSQAEFMRALKDAKQNTFVIDWDDLDRELIRAGVIEAPPCDVPK